MQTSRVDGGGSGGAEGRPGAAAAAGQPPGQGPGSGWVSTHMFRDLVETRVHTLCPVRIFKYCF